mgnify:CR=1 FL=1
MDHGASEDKQNNQDDEDCERCQEGPAERLVHADVDHVEERAVVGDGEGGEHCGRAYRKAW